MPKWKLEVKNEFGSDEEIVLRAGQYTKVTLIVSSESDYTYYERFFDFSSYEIYIEDQNIVSLEEKYEILPYKQLEYTTYIGLECINEIYTEEYTFTFSVKTKNEKLLEESIPKLKIVPTSVKINQTPQKLTLIPVNSTINEYSSSQLKLKEKINNIDLIMIKSRNQDDNYYFESASIVFSEDNYENKLVFLSSFGTKVSLKELEGENQFTYFLEFYNSKDEKCFYLNEDSKKLTINIKKGISKDFNEKYVKEIISSIENVTPKYDKTNNIQIKINIPFAPVYYKCMINFKENEEEGKKILYDIFTTPGEKILKFDGLQANKEYEGNCFFDNLDSTFINSKSRFVFISFGDVDKSDFKSKLIPSKDFNRITQCVEFNFASNSDTTSLNFFGPIAEQYCFDSMNEGEPIQIRITGSAECEYIQDEIEEENKKANKKFDIRKKYKICAKPGPFNKDVEYKNKGVQERFKKNFDKFIEKLSDGDKIEENLGLEGLIVESKNIYKEVLVLEKKLNIEIEEEKEEEEGKEEGKKEEKVKEEEKEEKLEDKIEEQKEEEKEEKKEEEKEEKKEEEKEEKTEGEKEEQKEEKIEEEKTEEKTEDKTEDKPEEKAEEKEEEKDEEKTKDKPEEKEDKIEDEKKENENPSKKIPLDCKLEKNRKHPYCLIDSSDPISNLMNSDIPEIITIIEKNGYDFALLQSNEQFKKIEAFKDEIIELEKGNKKDLIEKIIEYSHYLSLIDCVQLYDEKKGEFNLCRERKTEFFNIIIETLINNIFSEKKIDDFLEKGISDKKDINYKYLLWLINILSTNSDSLQKGNSKKLYNIIFKLKNYFSDFTDLEKNLDKQQIKDDKKTEIKKDLSILFAKSLSNLLNVFYYEELDENNRVDRRDKTGLIAYNDSSPEFYLYNNLLDYVKIFNEFGDGEYKISNKLSIYIKKIELESEKTLRKLKEENEEEIYTFQDKNIYVILKPTKILKNVASKIDCFKATIHVVNFESPLIPLNRNFTESTIREFIDITLYDINNKIIDVNSLLDDERPIILYNTEYYKNLDNCFYYNENEHDLDTEGIEKNFHYKYNNKEYLKCSSNHLTSFTAGNYIDYSSNISLININKYVTLCLIPFIFIGVILCIFILCKTKSKKYEGKNDNQKQRASLEEYSD